MNGVHNMKLVLLVILAWMLGYLISTVEEDIKQMEEDDCR